MTPRGARTALETTAADRRESNPEPPARRDEEYRMDAKRTGDRAHVPDDEPTISVIVGGFGDHAARDVLVMCAEQIELYSGTATRQMERIDAGFSAFVAAFDPAAVDPSRVRWQDVAAIREQVKADVHFYFTCWTMVLRAFERMKDRSRLGSLGDAWRRHERVLRHYDRARDHIEHLVDRMPGERNQKRLTDDGGTWGFGNVKIRDAGRFWQSGDDSWDISAGSVVALQEAASDVIGILRAEATARSEARRAPHPPS
jgi:hypothetical protein